MSYVALRVAPVFRTDVPAASIEEYARIYAAGCIGMIDWKVKGAIRWSAKEARENGVDEVTEVRVVLPDDVRNFTWDEFVAWVNNGEVLQ